MRKSILQTLLGLLYPEHCSGCGRFGVSICTSCALTLRLARPLERDTDFAVFDYGDNIVRQSIREFKYHHNARRAKILVHIAVPHIIDFLTDKLQSTSQQTIVLVPIPQHKLKTYSRGYNQSLLIATWLTKELRGSLVKELLYKNVPTVSQTKMNNKQIRMKNVAHTMYTTVSLDQKAVYIIVDDVMTTGATLNEARRALRQGGGKKILSVSIAHGYNST